MALDPLAPDLGAIRDRLERKVPNRSWAAACPYEVNDVTALLTAYDAQAARLAAVEAERDQARADLKSIADRLWREDEEYAARVARLAAKEKNP